MNSFRTLVVATLMALGAGVVLAQPGAGRGPGPMAAASAASGPVGPGMGPGRGMGPGAMHGGRWGSDYTPGWQLMTPEERNEHRDRMRSMKTYDECKAYQAQHHEQMVARAKERGGKALPQPRRDACAGLPK